MPEGGTKLTLNPAALAAAFQSPEELYSPGIPPIAAALLCFVLSMAMHLPWLANTPIAGNMLLAMLQVDHAHHAPAAHQWHRQKCLVTILRQFMEKLKARIVRSFLRNRNRLTMLRHPSCYALSNTEFQTIDHIRVRILRCPQHQLVIFQEVDQARVALHQG